MMYSTVLQSKRAHFLFAIFKVISFPDIIRKKVFEKILLWTCPIVDNRETIQVQPRFSQNLQRSVINVEITLDQ